MKDYSDQALLDILRTFCQGPDGCIRHKWIAVYHEACNALASKGYLTHISSDTYRLAEKAA